MENATLKNTTCFIKTNRTKPLKIKIKDFIDMLGSGVICRGLNFPKKFCCCAHRCAKNLKKSTQISKNIECIGAFT